MNLPSRPRHAVTRCLSLALLLGLLCTFAHAKPAKPPKIRDLADTISTNPILTKFALMVQASDMGTFLSSRGPFTVFAPTDSAFSRLPQATFDALLQPQNKERLQDIVLFHVVNGKRLTAKDLLLLKTVAPCQGPPLAIRTSHSGTQFVMKAKITHSEIKCANGIINEIDGVLMPPETSLPPLAAPPPPALIATTNTATVTTPSPTDTNASPTPDANMAPPADTNAPSISTNAVPVNPEPSTNAVSAETNAAPAAVPVAPAAH
jgi:uncharacterized surface protein with fasciclin (FAS1) repeats